MIRPPMLFKAPMQQTMTSDPSTPTPLQTTTAPPANHERGPLSYSSSSLNPPITLQSIGTQSWFSGRSTTSSGTGSTLGDSPQIVQQIIENVPNVATRLTRRIDGKTLQYSAIRDIAAVPLQHKQRILDDYLRIPVASRCCLVRDIICVPEELKAQLRLSTKVAREKMVKRVTEGDVEFYSLMKEQEARRQGFKHGRGRDLEHTTRLSGGALTAKSPKSEDDGSMVDSLIGHFADEYDTWIGKPPRNSISTSENTSDTLVPTSKVSSPRFHTPKKKLNVNAPSAKHPFAAFIKQPTAEEASRLPLELRLCYEAHDYVQEQLMRHKQAGYETGADAARAFWESTTKYFEVSEKVAMGAPAPMKQLSEAQLRYVWAGRFLERCQSEGW